MEFGDNKYPSVAICFSKRRRRGKKKENSKPSRIIAEIRNELCREDGYMQFDDVLREECSREFVHNCDLIFQRKNKIKKNKKKS